MLLKIKGEEIVIFGLSTMLLKRKVLSAVFHDIDEKKGIIENVAAAAERRR